MSSSKSFFDHYKTPDSQLKSVEFKDLPTPKKTPVLHAEAFVEMQEYARQRVRATVHFRAWTEPRGLIDFQSSWNVRTEARNELPMEKEFEKVIKEFVYTTATKNSLLLAFLSSEMGDNGASLVLSPRYWLDNISGIGWDALQA